MDGIDSFQAGPSTSSPRAGCSKPSTCPPRIAKIRERYGKGTDQEQGDAAPRLNEQFLLARRLVEAGVRVVTLSYSFWDWHGSNFRIAKENLPDFDQALSAIEDLDQRGLLESTTVIAWGEFGRTPRINKDGGATIGRMFAARLSAGGGHEDGQVIGATDRPGGEATQRPVTFSGSFRDAVSQSWASTRRRRPFPTYTAAALPRR